MMVMWLGSGVLTDIHEDVLFMRENLLAQERQLRLLPTAFPGQSPMSYPVDAIDLSTTHVPEGGALGTK